MIPMILNCVRLVSLWIFGVLNDVFVSGLPGLVGLPVHSQWVTFSSVRACFGLPLSCLYTHLYFAIIQQ